MVCDETFHHPMGEQNKAYMKIIPYKLKTTNNKITSRAGLLTIAQLMATLKLEERIDRHFPFPKSNRGFKPSIYLQTLILMQHEGSFHLSEVRNINDDQALRTILGLRDVPVETALGGWLRKMGNNPESFQSWVEVNKAVLKSALHQCRGVTLDIDATEIISHKSDAKYTYKKNKGYMPMVGHISETGQIVACDFRPGNASPMRENLEFIQQCEQSLPEECFVKSLRIDAAGYQTKIIKYCDEKMIKYAIRAKTSAGMRSLIESRAEDEWQPLIDKKGQPVENESTLRTTYCIGEYSKPFTLVIQRKAIKGQIELDLECSDTDEEITTQGYVYRAIATNQDDWSNSKIIHWYNQRAEDSENRIKELKLDFGGDTLPCSEFNANALYFLASSLSFNLFALMRHLIPEDLSSHRATTIRWRLYGIAAKIVKTGRQFFVRLQEKNQILLERVLIALRRLQPPPI
jgi:hypothetical protein